MEQFKSKENLEGALNIIEDCCKLINQGRIDHWVSVAVQLYILLIDRGNKKGPLIEAFYPNITFHPILGYWPNDAKSALSKLIEIHGPDNKLYPGMTRVKNGKIYPVYVFDERAAPILREEWLNQPYISGKITIKELLKSVRNKEGAHSDEKYDDTLAKTRFFMIAGIPIDVIGIASIGEYVVRRIRSMNPQ
jgi:hypothetical protein